jgi:predicted signal transduction protein with EAL and GGDEF domain
MLSDVGFEITLLVAGVQLTRTGNFHAFAVHFVPVRNPAHGACHGEDHGYSSLSQLARFPIDAIKLDQAFVRDIHKQSVSQSLVRAIVAVAQALNLQVIAEGVESAKEDAFLTKNGVNERQGFHFAKPMPATAFERWFKRYQARNAR